MDKETKIDIVFFPSGEIKSISSNTMNYLIQREYNIDSTTMEQEIKNRNLLGIIWDNTINEWSISDYKLNLFLNILDFNKQIISMT